MNHPQKLILLTTNPKITTIENIIDYATSSGVKVQCLDPFNQINLIDIEDTSGIWILPRTSGILFDDLDLHLCEAWIKQGALCPIPIESIKVLRDKDRQYLVLKKWQLPLVKTLIHRGPLTESQLCELSNSSEQWVLKSIRGNKGIGIEKYRTRELLDFWEMTYKQRRDQRYLIQEYIPHAREVRVLALGHKLYAIEKINTDTMNWKKNAQYARFEKATLTSFETKEFIKYSQIIRENLKLPCFAIDLIMDNSTQQWQILEVNVHPGLAASSEAMQKDFYEEYWNALFHPEKEHSLDLNF